MSTESMQEPTVCKACQDRVDHPAGIHDERSFRTLARDNPKCAFTSGQFNSNNWNCALASKIRELATREGDRRIHHHCPENQHYATIDTQGFNVLPEENDEGFLNFQPVCLYVGWYKSRGRTEVMWLMFETDPPRVPTEEECLKILEHYTR